MLVKQVNMEKLSWKPNSVQMINLNKTLKLQIIAIIVRSVFEEDSKYYPQAFLDEYLYEL